MEEGEGGGVRGCVEYDQEWEEEERVLGYNARGEDEDTNSRIR